MSDLDRHCLRQQRTLETCIERIEAICQRFPHSARCQPLRELRNELVIELHDTKRAHSAYDRRRAEAYDDPTGQDGDSFDVGESSHGWQRCGGGYMSNGRGGYKEDFGG